MDAGESKGGSKVKYERLQKFGAWAGIVACALGMAFCIWRMIA